MASHQAAKPSLVGDLVAQTLKFTAQDAHNLHRHGLLSPSTSTSRSHEGGEEIVALQEKPAICRRSSLELGEDAAPNTRLLVTSHSPPSENVQDLGQDTTTLFRCHSPPSRDIQGLASEAAKEQSPQVSQQPLSFPTPIPTTPLRANSKNPQGEPTCPKKPCTQLAPRPLSQRARRMAPTKVPTPPISLNVRILALADRHAHPYAFISPKHAFTLRLVPDTNIREVCTHAGDYLDLHFDEHIDSRRLEARDANGHVFDGTEAVGQELGVGGDLYLIEEALDVDESRKAFLRTLDAQKNKEVRTPKVKKVKEPRKTPSQRSLEIAEQGGRMARTEPRKTPSQGRQTSRIVRSESRRRTLAMPPLELEDGTSSPAPRRMSLMPQLDQGPHESKLVQSIENSSPTARLEKRCHSGSRLAKDIDASEHGLDATATSPFAATSMKGPVPTIMPTKPKATDMTMVQSIDDEPSITKEPQRRIFPSRPAEDEEQEAASVPAVAMQHKLLSSASTAGFQPQDERVIPHSHGAPSPSVDALFPNTLMATSWTPINAPRPSAEILSRSATRPKAAKSRSPIDAQDGAKQHQPQFLLGKPDPYDISAVLSDDEYYSPRQSSAIMSSSIRKLGSATKRTATGSSSVPRNSLLIAKQPPAGGHNQSRVATKSAATSQEEDTVPSTPVARAPPNTPAQTGPSSAPGPLLSSPTNHVAAALARGRAKARRQSQPECVVIEESDVEVFQNVLVDARDQMHTSRREAKSLEASLPWSAPPLRIGEEDPFWTLRTTGRRTSMRDRSDLDEQLDADVSKDTTRGVERQIAMPGLECGVPKTQTPSTSAISSFNLGPPVYDPTKRSVNESSRRSPLKIPPKPSSQGITGKSPLLLVHGSSSSEQGVEEIGSADITLANGEPASCAKVVETVVIQGSSSQDIVEDEDEAYDFMAELSLADALLSDKEPIEPRQVPPEQDDGRGLPKDDDARLPDFKELPILPLPEPFEDHDQAKDEPVQLTRVPETDPMSDNVLVTTPPSGQPTKRKRVFKDDPDSEEERRMQKRARHEARAAKKAERKQLRKEKLAQEEEEQRKHQACLQEERKRLAMEEAYRRARELEIVVSSPAKAAKLGLDSSDAYDSNQESELGSSPPIHGAVLPVFEESHGSLEGRESSETRSCGHLRKGDFTASPSSSLKHGVADDPTGSLPLNKSGATVVKDTKAGFAGLGVEVGPEVGDAAETKERVQRKAFEDWAFLEAIMDTSAHSPLQMHYRIHMQMVHASLQGAALRRDQNEDAASNAKMGEDTGGEKPVESRPKRVVKHQDPMFRGPSEDAQAREYAQVEEEVERVNGVDEEEEEEEEDDPTRQTRRSPAPSPKDLTPATERVIEENNGKKKREMIPKKSQRRKGKDSTRKKKWRRKEKPGMRKDFNRKHTFQGKGGNQ